MTSDKNGNYTGAYTYGLDRISADNLSADSKDNPLYYLYDGRGSVGQLINSSGEVKNSYSYDPFGATDHDGPLGNSKAHYQDYFGFNGEEYNNISGLQYLRARYYEADSGRFLTRDSYMGNTMNPLSLNRYDYALNNPVMNIDPSGHRALAVDEDGVAAITQRYGTLRNGSSDNTQRDVSLLQTMLNTAGFNPGTIDGIFGNNTEKAVRAYQASKGLTVDGIVGNQTWRSLGGKVTAASTASNSNELPMLRKGSSNKDAVKKLQQALIDQHYDLGPSGADGIFGNKTVQAVLNFQWDKNLSVDGIVGSQTWEALSKQGKACDGKDYIGSQETGNQTLGEVLKLYNGNYLKYAKDGVQKYFLLWVYGTNAGERFNDIGLQNSFYMIPQLSVLQKSGRDLSQLTVKDMDDIYRNATRTGLAIDFLAIAAASYDYGAIKGVSNPLDIVPEVYRSQVENAFEGTITKVTNDEDMYVYRHWGGDSAESGSPWYSTQIYSPEEAKANLALPECNTAQNVTEYKIPKGSTYLMGEAKSMVGVPGFGDYATGGGEQIYLPDPSIAVKIK